MGICDVFNSRIHHILACPRISSSSSAGTRPVCTVTESTKRGALGTVAAFAVGGIVVPSSGLPLGHPDASRLLFGISAFAAPVVLLLLAYRARKGPPLPLPMRPSWFILLVPPSLIYANGITLFAQTFFLESLYFAALILGAALLVNARTLWQWPFGAPWWAFTFPLDAVAYAAARYAQDHPAPLWQALSGATLALATLFVATVLLRFLAAILRSGASRPA